MHTFLRKLIHTAVLRKGDPNEKTVLWIGSLFASDGLCGPGAGDGYGDANHPTTYADRKLESDLADPVFVGGHLCGRGNPAGAGGFHPIGRAADGSDPGIGF